MEHSDLNFAGKVALVTGAASGIGRSTAVGLAERGAKVGLVDRNAEVCIELEKTLNTRFKECAIACSADVSNVSSIERCVMRVTKQCGHIDAVAHCAGIQTYGNASDTTTESWSSTLATNLDSAFYLARTVLPGMKERGTGSIVFIGSTQSLVANQNSVAYVTGKHAIVGFMRSIALDFASTGIRANCVLPGAIDTPMVREAANRDANPERVLDACCSLSLFGRMGRPEEVANVVLFLLSDMASFITGTTIVVDGGQMVPCGGAAFQLTGTGAVGRLRLRS